MSERDQVQRAHALIRRLASAGVDTWCIAPGGRNAPIAAALARTRGISVFEFFEERSAAFFALGRARASGRPVAVSTTSGTASVELAPAVVEAHYTMTPLVLVTADRPHRLRGTGAPQSIDQTALFAGHAPLLDLDATDDPHTDETSAFFDEWRCGPIHVNIAFDEPLLPKTVDDVADVSITPADPRSEPPRDDAASDRLAAFLGTCRRPLVLLGSLAPEDVAPTREFARHLGAPVLAECLSQLREAPDLDAIRLRAPDHTLRRLFDDGVVDGVLRLGGIPTHRIWRDLDASLAHVPVCSVSAHPFAGLARGTLIETALADVLRLRELLHSSSPAPRQDDRDAARAIDDLLAREPQSEPALVRALSRIAVDDVFLGNSLPIREWDAFADSTYVPARRMHASRGVNGIDGQLSTGLGIASAPARSTDAEREAWIVLGDLTTLYDLAGPWILERLERTRIRIAVINNGGGRIFDRVFGRPDFRNAHAIGFAPWAQMWGLDHVRAASPDDLASTASLPDRAVVEITPDDAANERFWRAYDELIRS